MLFLVQTRHDGGHCPGYHPELLPKWVEERPAMAGQMSGGFPPSEGPLVPGCDNMGVRWGAWTAFPPRSATTRPYRY